MNYDNLDLFFYRHNKREARVIPLQPHQINFCELTLCLDGELNYSVSDIPAPLQAGDAVFIKSGQKRSRSAGKNYADYVSFNFHCESDLPLPALMKKAVDKEIRLQLMCCDESFSLRALNPNITLSLLAVLNKLILQQTSPDYSPLTRSVLSILQRELYGKITLREISRQTYFSSAYCQSVFKADTGKSIIQYFNRLKTEEAKALMIQGESSLSKISEKLGYDDYNYFSRLFKKECGYSPKEYLTNLIKE